MDFSTQPALNAQVSNTQWEEPNHVINANWDVLNVSAIALQTHYHLPASSAYSHSVITMELVYHAVILIKLLLEAMKHVKHVPLTALIAILPPIVPNVALILSLLLMDLVLNVAMDSTQSITILVQNASLIALIVLIIPPALIVHLDIALMEPIIAGPAMFPTVLNAIHRIFVLLVILPILLIVEITLVIATILMSSQIILASVLQEE